MIYSDPQCDIYVGDCRDVLKELPEHSADCIITSPPYWGLRSYAAPKSIWDGDKDCVHEWDKEIKIKKTGGKADTQKLLGGTISTQEGNRFETLSRFCLKCGAWQGVLGSESTIQLYISHLVGIFEQCKRVLKPTGSLWVNLADSMAGSNCGSNDYRAKGSSISCNPDKYQGQKPGNRWDKWRSDTENSIQVSHHIKRTFNIPAKSLCAIPERFVVAMTDAGWIRRNTIIWKKDSCMPQSAKDRFTIDFEYLYFFTLQQKYFFERQFEPYQECSVARLTRAHKSYDPGYPKAGPQNLMNGETLTLEEAQVKSALGRNKRAVWTINDRMITFENEGFPPLSIPESLYYSLLAESQEKGSVWVKNPEPQKPVKKGQVAHYAAFPTALCTTPILSTVPEQICTKCGKPRVKIYEEAERINTRPGKNVLNCKSGSDDDPNKALHSSDLSIYRQSVTYKEVGLSDCGCGAPFQPGVVADIFGGTGTVAVEARNLGRRAILIECSQDYCEIARKRLEKIPLPFGFAQGKPLEVK